MALQALKVDAHALAQRDADDVRGAPVAERFDVVRAVDDGFAEEKAGCEIEVVAGGAEGDGDGLVADTDLERLLDGEDVVELRGGVAVDAKDAHRRALCAFGAPRRRPASRRGRRRSTVERRRLGGWPGGVLAAGRSESSPQRSEAWSFAAAVGPDREHFDGPFGLEHAVVEVVPNPGEMNATDLRQIHVQRRWTNPRLVQNEPEHACELVMHGRSRGAPVLAPP